MMGQMFITHLYNNQINARALIGQPAMVYCAIKLMENSASSEVTLSFYGL